MADKRISQLVERTDIANNDVVPIVASGATTTNKATISSIQEFMQENLDLGVTSVGITLGSSGTDVSVTGSPITTSGNITINIPSASASARGLVTTGSQTFAGTKTFQNQIEASSGIVLGVEGTANPTFFRNSSASQTSQSGFNGFGFNNQNHIYFNKGTTLNAGFFLFNNTAARSYTLPDATGTIALTSQLDGYVTLDTAQTITAQKVFTTSGSSDSVIITHGSGSGFALDVIKAGNGEVVRVNKTSGSGNAMTVIGGNFEAPTIVKTGGTSSQFLKADGSVDSSTYLTTGTAASTYVPYTGATGAVDLGTHTLSSNNLIANGGLNAGALLLKNANAASTINTGYFTLSPSSTTTQISFGFSTGASTWKKLVFSSHLLTDNTPTLFSLPNGGGTLAVTTDLGAYLPLTGGTLTGALNGTSASFTGAVLIDSLVNANQGNLVITSTNNDASGLSFKVKSSPSDPTNSRSWMIHSNYSEAGTLEILRSTTATGNPTTFALKLNGSTGAATFSSSVTANGVVGDWGLSIFGNTTTGQSYGGIIRGGTNSSDVAFAVNNAVSNLRYFTVRGDGNVGIGTASPQRRLDVFTTASSATEYQLSLRNGQGLNNVSAGIAFGFNSSSLDPDYLSAISSIITNRSTRAADLTFLTAATGTLVEQMRITSDGYQRMSSGTGGIQFNGDTAAANALDDYEEGTWTPTVADASSGGNLATLTGDSHGVYTKIGRVVYFRFSVILSSKASMTAGNEVFVRGFPFTSQTISGNWYNPNAAIIRNVTFTGYVQFHQVPASTYGYFRENVSNAAGDNIIVSDLTDSAAMQVSGFYFI